MKLYAKHYGGHGEALIILHGLFGNQSNWAMHAKALTQHFSVYGVDARNHGRSPWDESMSYQEMAADLVETMDMLGLAKAHILAHSMGGKIAMQFALQSPGKTDKLVVVDIAPLSYPPGHDHILDALCQLDLSQLENRRQADELLQTSIEAKGVRDFLLTNLQKNDNKQFEWRMNLDAIKANYELIRGGLQTDSLQFNGDVLFIKGANSDYIKASSKKAIVAIFPQAKVKIILQAGHWVHSEKPQAFLKIVESFLLG